MRSTPFNTGLVCVCVGPWTLAGCIAGAVGMWSEPSLAQDAAPAAQDATPAAQPVQDPNAPPSQPQQPAPPTAPQQQPPAPADPQPGYPQPGYPQQQAYPQQPPYYSPAPPELEYEEGMAIPPGYRRVERTRKGLTISGSIVLGIFYGLSLSIAMGTIDTDDETGWLAIPVAGPFIMSSTIECDPIDEFGCNDSSTRTLLIFDGIGQLTGATLLTLGFTMPKEVLVPEYADLHLVPTRVGQDGYGLGAIGRF